MVENNNFKTSDTALASFLITKNFSVLFIDYEKPRFEYHFTNSTEIRNLADDYITGNALANPASYTRVYRKLNRVIRKMVQWRED